jgi:hypothetical protein
LPTNAATLARLIAYVGALALLGMAGLHQWDELPAANIEPASKPGWSVASRSCPAIAVSAFDPAEKSETYEIFRRLEGGRWSCQGSGLPARRAAIGCMLDRLTLLASGNEPKLAELFARAELKRGSCATAATSAVSADWVPGTEDPRLRGPL